MSPEIALIVLAGYFGLLYAISHWTNRGGNDSTQGFFVGGRSAPWWGVAIGMIGTSLSGVTFVSVPGDVGKLTAPDAETFRAMGYLQFVLGNFLGYLLIAFVLLPVYYRTRLTSIYSFLGERLGWGAQRTGSFFFLVSRALGSAARLYLGVKILQAVVLDQWNVPFELAALLTLAFILLYTRKGGLKTIIWTDVLQTLTLVGAAAIVFFVLADRLGADSMQQALTDGPFSQLFFWDWQQPNFFFKQIVAGMLIALVMTGLDQDMMQKNLACRSLKEARWNVQAYGAVLVVVNFLFVALGVLLYTYASQVGFVVPEQTDYLFPMLAQQELGMLVGMLVLLGLIASSYSSADGTLTALSTSICIDWLNFEKQEERPEQLKRMRRVHLYVTAGFGVLLLLFEYSARLHLQSFNMVTLVLTMAGYTYGPLLALFVRSWLKPGALQGLWVAVVCGLAPLLSFGLVLLLKEQGYAVGFELILINACIAYAGLLWVPKEK